MEKKNQLVRAKQRKVIQQKLKLTKRAQKRDQVGLHRT